MGFPVDLYRVVAVSGMKMIKNLEGSHVGWVFLVFLHSPDGIEVVPQSKIFI
jgi:hypothetical protein